MHEGKAKFVYNVLGIHSFPVEADKPVPAGAHQVRMELAYDGGGLAKGGDVTLYYDGDAVGTGQVDATQPMVSPDYTGATSRFRGKIKWVQIDLGDDNLDHFIDPEERVRIAMAQ